MPPSPEPRTEAFNIKLPLTLAKRFVAACQRLGITRTEGMKRAVEVWLETVK
jgi:hypothetical protein